jgi:hypothetical protein
MADDKVCAIERPDGGVSVVIPNWNKFTLDPVVAENEGKQLIEDFDAYVDGELAKQVGVLTEVRRCVCPKTGLPWRGKLRDAWRLKAAGDGVEMDMPAARVIRTDAVRVERNERLKEADIEYSVADEKGDAPGKSAAGVKRQALRDIPATIQPDLEAITDPETLENCAPAWPE